MVRKSEREASLGSALPIEAFYRDAQELSPQDFEGRHGAGFLMATAAGVSGRNGATGTELLLDGVDSDPAARTANVSVLIYPLHPRGGPAGHLVTMGRDSRHDVVIPDRSVSRFHAIAKCNPDGSFLLQDMSSTNGTTVNGASVSPRGAGEPTPLKPGDTVKLGRVEFTFSDARALREFALQAAS